ncbi:MAG: bile acid 7-alpha dehydratase [Halioglobus sp.]|mgnify:CR=1 FL=1|nr:bile acid 7-alpha dehydratase [Halioglobus sp.]|tara:strand:- start:560 stop:1075 length:516 start_codon:yes stop_codon:yes gene_type:complete
MELEQRIARLEAIEAIRQLKYRYFHACDQKQPEQVRECFAPGPIELEYGRIGSFGDREDMLAVFTELACQPHIVEMHHGQNPQIELHSADEASGTWGLYYCMIDTRRDLFTQLGGVYDDRYRRIDGQWKIVRSCYEVTSTAIYDLAEGLARSVFAGRAAPQALDDPAQQAG